MVKTAIEKKSVRWLGILVLVMSIIYILSTLGKTEWVTWIAIIFGYFLSIFLLIEGGVYEYWRSKHYKQIGFGDVMVWLTTAAAFVVFLNTTLLINIIKNVAPEWLINFATTTGVTAGVVAGILGIVYIFKVGKFK